MKKILIILLFVFVTTSAFARKEYCTLKAELRAGNLIGWIDYGEKKDMLTDKVDGKTKINFKSIIDMINCLAKQGWELVPINLGDSYLFVREVE